MPMKHVFGTVLRILLTPAIPNWNVWVTGGPVVQWITHLTMECLDSSASYILDPSLLLMQSLGGSRCCCLVLGLLPFTWGDLVGVLTLVASSLVWPWLLGHLGSELMDKRFLLLSYSLLPHVSLSNNIKTLLKYTIKIHMLVYLLSPALQKYSQMRHK